MSSIINSLSYSKLLTACPTWLVLQCINYDKGIYRTMVALGTFVVSRPTITSIVLPQNHSQLNEEMLWSWSKSGYGLTAVWQTRDSAGLNLWTCWGYSAPPLPLSHREADITKQRIQKNRWPLPQVVCGGGSHGRVSKWSEENFGLKLLSEIPTIMLAAVVSTERQAKLYTINESYCVNGPMRK